MSKFKSINSIDKLDDYFEELEKVAERSFRTDRVMRQIAEETIKLIQKRTRKGTGVPKAGGAKRRLKPLTPEYKKYRRKLKKQGRLSPKTTPAKSNLTLTGEMIDSMDYRLSRGQIIIFSGKDDLVKYNEEGGRVFLNLSNSEFNIVAQSIFDAFTKALGNV